MNLGKETETLEFKKSTGEIREGMVSIASILNKHGVGTLYFGIKPNGDVIGQDISESSLRDVSRAVYESIKPQIYPAINEEVLDGRHVIKVEFSGENAPYSAGGRYYLRTADEDRESCDPHRRRADGGHGPPPQFLQRVPPQAQWTATAPPPKEAFPNQAGVRWT